jgi:F-type H+-transporting ATPase subunit gamma
MGNSIKDIRRKIKSIRSTRQITKAMELVATSKMKKAVDNAVNLRSYGYSAMNILAKLSKKQKDSHPYLQDRDVKNVLVLLFTTDKGLCGGLNTNLFRKTTHLIASLEKDYSQAAIHFVTSGRKGADFLRRMGKTVDMAFPAYSVHPKFSDIFPLSALRLKGLIKAITIKCM